MLSISLQGLDSTQSVLAALMDAKNAQLAANAAAESYMDDTLDWIAAGKAFTPRHGGAGLEGAISWRPTGSGAIVYANKAYAQYVEEGTGIHAGHQPWVVGPKAGRNGIKIPTGGKGGYVVGSHKMRSGSKAYPFFFADADARRSHMAMAMRSVLLERISRG